VVTCPLVPGVPHLLSGSCSSPRACGLGFLQTSPRDDALALLPAFGSTHTWHGDFHPVSSVPCLAHTPPVSGCPQVQSYEWAQSLRCGPSAPLDCSARDMALPDLPPASLYVAPLPGRLGKPGADIVVLKPSLRNSLYLRPVLPERRRRRVTRLARCGVHRVYGAIVKAIAAASARPATLLRPARHVLQQLR
jgi:hypothetical protein